jgi:hypothetical protein
VKEDGHSDLGVVQTWWRSCYNAAHSIDHSMLSPQAQSAAPTYMPLLGQLGILSTAYHRVVQDELENLLLPLKPACSNRSSS